MAALPCEPSERLREIGTGQLVMVAALKWQLHHSLSEPYFYDALRRIMKDLRTVEDDRIARALLDECSNGN